MTEAFSRSRKPTRPISWLSEKATSGASFRRISAARNSISGVTGEKTDVMDAARNPRRLISPPMRTSSASSSGAMARPSIYCHHAP